MRTIPTRPLFRPLLSPLGVVTAAALAAPTLGGCAITGMMDQRDAVIKMQAEAAQRGAAAQKLKQTEMFVVADQLWFCTAATDAKQNKTCDGGKKYTRNQTVTVIGTGAEAGLWTSEYWDAKGSHRGFVLASALNELPDISGLDDFTRDVDKRYPEPRRIPIQAVNYEDMITQPKAYQGRYLVLRQPSRDMTNKEFLPGVFSFTIPVPVLANDRLAALAQFEFKNHALVEEFEAGERKYQCGPSYCDEFVIVAELTTRTIDRPDKFGNVHRLPVFTILEMGDRYGNRKAD